MKSLFYYRDDDLFIHHTMDEQPDPDNFPVHAHERMEIFYFLSGHGAYLIEGSQYELNEGDVLIMRHAEAHKLLILPDAPYDRIAIHFSPRLLAPLDPEGTLLRPFLNRPLGHRNRVTSALGQQAGQLLQLDALQASPYQTRLRIISYLLPLLCELNSSFFMDTASTAEGKAQPLAAQLTTYINDHLYADISLDTLCQLFFLSRSQINRVFTRATGTSIWRYVTIKRLLAARAMIRNHEPAGSVCVRCGFSDYSAFYRAYKARFGCSPAEDARQA